MRQLRHGTHTAKPTYRSGPITVEPSCRLPKRQVLNLLHEANDVSVLVAPIADPASRWVHMEVRTTAILVKRAPADERGPNPAQLNAVAGYELGDGMLTSKRLGVDPR
jgi:hypothetical protein